ncbi:hypothetical protein jhhlp_006944 [Lomentospora prolificans]|uniref:Sfi1 spindle body domain-containing protein n=1 Tax=Lomentospora prolificans TaxID=41688 RepID=A0A2N3N370_9PEZI|nr:hypothetical protein jhhlp_006944 [Lomentospora prolificans]
MTANLGPKSQVTRQKHFTQTKVLISTDKISIIHDIVVAAQEQLDAQPERDRVPTNALFQAYDAVLPIHGIDPENDQHLSRLVFRIGGERGECSLLEKFGSVLSRMGIELEFDSSSILADPDLGDVAETARVFSPGHRAAISHPDPSPDVNITAVNLPSADVNTTSQTPSSSITHSTSSRSQATIPRRVTGHLLHTSHESLTAQATPRPYDEEVAQSTSNEPPLASASSNKAPSIPIHLASLGTEPATAVHEGQETRHAQLAELPFPSLRQRLFTTWLSLVTPLSNTDEYRGILASTVYERNASEGILTRWKSLTYGDKVAQMGTCLESYAIRCERIAGRARQIYILTTGFGLWHRVSSATTERTALARRHILRMRHFESWKEVAIGEYRTTRLFVLGVYLPRWLKQSESVCRQEETAREACLHIMLSREFMAWQRLSLENIIHSKRAQSIKESIFALWFKDCRQRAEVSSECATQHRKGMLIASFLHWQVGAKSVEAQYSISYDAFRTRMLSTLFPFWLGLSHSRAGTPDIYARTLLSKSLRAWNTETKIRIFQASQEHRSVSEYFLLWMTWQRIQAFQSKREMHLMCCAFRTALDRSNELEARFREGQSQAAVMYVCQPTISNQFQLWYQISKGIHYLDTQIVNESGAVVASRYLDKWSNSVFHNSEMERWASRGAFYLAVHQNLSNWKNWAKGEKERKLRTVYTIAKHKVNERLILSCWDRWKATCASATTLNRTSTHKSHTRDRGVTAMWMENWVWTVQHTSALHQQSQQTLSQLLLHNWRELAETYVHDDLEAAHAWTERMSDSCWSRWDIAFRWAEGQSYNAENMIRKRRKETLVKSFLIWKGVFLSDETEELTRGSVDVALTQSNMTWKEASGRHRYTLGNPQLWSRPYSLDFNPVAAHSRSDHQDGDFESTDGTLNTPTRWTGLPSTTPSGPLPTPYERELRQRYIDRMGRGSTYTS